MSDDSLIEEIEDATPPEAKKFFLYNRNTSSRLPQEQGKFFSASPVEWPVGITDGSWVLQFVDEQGALIRRKERQKYILDVVIPKRSSEPPKDEPSAKGVAGGRNQIEEDYLSLRLSDHEHRSRQNAEVREDFTKGLRDLYALQHEWALTTRKELTAWTVEQAKLLEQQKDAILGSVQREAESVKREREASATIWKEIDELRSQAKPDYAKSLEAIGSSLIKAIAKIWLAYLSDGKKKKKKKADKVTALLMELTEPGALEKLVSSTEEAEKFRAKVESAVGKAEALTEPAATPKGTLSPGEATPSGDSKLLSADPSVPPPSGPTAAAPSAPAARTTEQTSSSASPAQAASTQLSLNLGGS